MSATGIHVKRDNLLSVRYAEVLHSTTSSVTLQRADRQAILGQSLRIVNYLRDNATRSVRHLAQKTGFSKSSVHRLQQAMERRDRHPESWLWEPRLIFQSPN